VARKRNFDDRSLGRFLVKVDRIKSAGKPTDAEVLIEALQAMK
jgi:hypothetical protein